MTVTPVDLLRFMPFLPNAFGRAELEFAGVLVVLWHYDQKHVDWQRVSPKTVVEWALASELPIVVKLRNNPFFLPDFEGLRVKGFVEGWENPSDVGIFSAEGLARLESIATK